MIDLPLTTHFFSAPSPFVWRLSSIKTPATWDLLVCLASNCLYMSISLFKSAFSADHWFLLNYHILFNHTASSFSGPQLPVSTWEYLHMWGGTGSTWEYLHIWEGTCLTVEKWVRLLSYFLFSSMMSFETLTQNKQIICTTKNFIQKLTSHYFQLSSPRCLLQSSAVLL